MAYCCSRGLLLASVVGQAHCCSVVSVNNKNSVQLPTFGSSNFWVPQTSNPCNATEVPAVWKQFVTLEQYKSLIVTFGAAASELPRRRLAGEPRRGARRRRVRPTAQQFRGSELPDGAESKPPPTAASWASPVVVWSWVARAQPTIRCPPGGATRRRRRPGGCCRS